MRKSPCTVTRPPGHGAVSLQPAHAELERGADLAQRVEERAAGRPAGRPAAGRRSAPGSMVWMAASARAALRGQRAPGPGPLGVAQDLARDGLALQPLDHQPVRARARRPRPWPRPRAPGRRRRAAASSSARSICTFVPAVAPSPRSIWRISGRGLASGHLEVERARHPRGAAREPAQAPHGPAELRARARPPAPPCSAAAPSPTRPGRQASRCRRAGAGTRRCRNRSASHRRGPRRSSGPAPR